ncbi:MAG: hypothetical protein CSA38_04900 [Flavobacteriales bacterium]|nr:MAG: hypothetical protein CSA38_04900 [Flavobacteriales bacterium]
MKDLKIKILNSSIFLYKLTSLFEIKVFDVGGIVYIWTVFINKIKFIMKKIISCFIVLLTLYNCASVSQKQYKGDLNVKTQLKEFNGIYDAFPYYSYEKKEEKDLKEAKHIYIYEIMQNTAPYYDKINFETYDKVKIEIQGSNSLSYSLISNNDLIKKGLINFTFKNGMMKLKNNFYKCEGVPFIFGGCREGFVKLGKSNNGDLIIQKSYDQYGAILFIFGAGLNHNVAYKYKKNN